MLQERLRICYEIRKLPWLGEHTSGRYVNRIGSAMKLPTFLPTAAKQLARRSLYRYRNVKNSLRRSRERLIQSVVRDYSQAGETVAVRRLTRRKYGGIFVEIGANDGVSLSTTYGLLQSGWQGWSIEANPATYQRLVENLRPFPQAKPINIAIAPSRGRVKLFWVKMIQRAFTPLFQPTILRGSMNTGVNHLWK